jgi:uncharacterized protein (DUF2384 family)
MFTYTRCDRGTLSAAGRDQIIPLKTLKKRLANGRRLSVNQSYRLSRVPDITAMAELLFEAMRRPGGGCPANV